MKLSKILGVVAAAALALMAFANTASATTIETNGMTQLGTVTIHATGTGSIVLKDTAGAFANTCTVSTIHGWTTVFSGPEVSGPINTLTFESCTNEKVVVDAAGTLSASNIPSSTNGTLKSNGAKVTVPSPFGLLTCTTNNTDVGTATGSTAPVVTVIHVNAVLNCGPFLPSAKWEGTYNVTGHSLGFVP